MKLTKLVLIVTALAVAASPVMAAEVYTIDPVHSTVGFTVKHMVVSKVRGNFETFEGTIHYDPEDVTNSKVSVTIQTDSIDTDNADRDKHLRSPDFFAADEYPTITFESTSVEKTDDGFIAHGDLTMRGVTKKVSLPFSITGEITDPWGNQRMGLEIEPVVIDRQDYGISWSKVLDAGGLAVSNDVTVDLAVAAVKKPEKEAESS